MKEETLNQFFKVGDQVYFPLADNVILFGVIEELLKDGLVYVKVKETYYKVDPAAMFFTYHKARLISRGVGAKVFYKPVDSDSIQSSRISSISSVYRVGALGGRSIQVNININENANSVEYRSCFLSRFEIEQALEYKNYHNIKNKALMIYETIDLSETRYALRLQGDRIIYKSKIETQSVKITLPKNGIRAFLNLN